MELLTNFLIICLLSLFLITKPVSSQFHYASEFCSDGVGTYTTNSTYQNNLDSLLSNLTNKASISLFNNDTIGGGIDQTYGLFMCRPDLTNQQCHDCVSEASTKITELCPVQKESIIWYFECLVRYANHSIFSRYEEQSPRSFRLSAQNFSDPERFGQVFSQTVNTVIMQAAYNTSSGGFAAAQANVTVFEAVYVVAQCTPDILGSQCERCLRVALRFMAGCCGTSRAFVDMFLTSCWLRYDQSPIVGEVNRAPALSPPLPISPLDLSPPSVLPPSPGSSTSAASTSRGISLVLGILMVVSMSFNRAW